MLASRQARNLKTYRWADPIAAGKAISDGLRKGGTFKVLFFVTQETGRVNQQDAATLNSWSSSRDWNGLWNYSQYTQSGLISNEANSH